MKRATWPSLSWPTCSRRWYGSWVYAISPSLVTRWLVCRYAIWPRASGGRESPGGGQPGRDHLYDLPVACQHCYLVTEIRLGHLKRSTTSALFERLEPVHKTAT